MSYHVFNQTKLSSKDLEKIGKKIIKILDNESCKILDYKFQNNSGYVCIDKGINTSAIYEFSDLLDKYSNLLIDIKKSENGELAVFFTIMFF
jgi:hypothetical protein